MSAQSLTLPASATQLRINRSLELCLFDEINQMIGAISLKNEMVTVMLIDDPDRGLRYYVAPDRAEPNQTYAVHFPIALPTPDSNYYDDFGENPNEGHAESWSFFVGFNRDPKNQRKGTLTGIGTVDIADISISPNPTARLRQIGCLQRFWNWLTGRQVEPDPYPSGILDLPPNFPHSIALQLNMELEFAIMADRVMEGANHIRLGAFLGKASASGEMRTYLAVCANPQLVVIHTEPITADQSPISVGK